MYYLKLALCYLLGVFFIFAGVMHFVNPALYLPMMPEYLPLHEELIFISGLAEIAAGILVLIPKTRRIGGWAVIAVLVAVYPANINMALNPDEFTDIMSPTALYIRLPIQFVAIAWAWWCTRPTQGTPLVEISANNEDTDS
ncbi:MAG: DoxX family protein [Candidatus Hydrogenedentota bacterium]|nr:MAG: DoxX family protein [Candidatus Hydrogenedentota bacterium]